MDDAVRARSTDVDAASEAADPLQTAAAIPGATAMGGLRAPLYIAWQLTNECNFACLHCIEQSGPGKAFKDELDDDQLFAVMRQAIDLEVPYISLSGGEPMLHPRFFDLVAFAAEHGAQLKIETNGAFLTKEACCRLKALNVKSVQVSLDGATRETYNRMRVRAEFDRVIEGIRNLREAGVPLEINYSPTEFNAHEIGRAVDLAYELGAGSFYTGRTMYTGNAVKAWHKLGVSDAQYERFFDTLRVKVPQYEGRMRVHFHEMGLLHEIRERVENPAALLIVLPNGLVKLINALPFVCGDLRRESLETIWDNFRRAWLDPQVTQFVKDLEKHPGKTAELHRWIYV